MLQPHEPEAAHPPASIIATLHARYEASMAEYSAIDTADTRLTEDRADRMLGYRYADAMKASDSEHDALRSAILYQVPDTWIEAMILLYHIRVQHDLTTLSAGASEAERLALDTAIDTLFDFLVASKGLKMPAEVRERQVYRPQYRASAA